MTPPSRYPDIYSHAGGDLRVEVELMNQSGEVALVRVLEVPDVDYATALAEDTLNDGHAFGSQSWAMNETRPA